MQTQIVEVTNGRRNWGKFSIGKFVTSEEFHRSSVTADFLHDQPHDIIVDDRYVHRADNYDDAIRWLAVNKKVGAVNPVSQTPLLAQRGWRVATHRLVLDLETGEGAIFAPGGSAHADLEKHKIWVCPMFEPFLEWWYKQWPTVDVGTFPNVVDLPDAEFSMYGYRRPADTWNDDHLQFARLLSEIVATQDNLDIGELRESMDLTSAEIDELFDRAQMAWERAKEAHT